MNGLDINELLGDFLVEAGELVDSLGDQLVRLEKQPDDAELLNAVFRAFHTVKGGAGFLELKSMVELCHGAEEVFDALRHGEAALDAAMMDAALEAVDVLVAMMNDLRAGADLQAPPAALLAALKAAAEGQPTSAVVVEDEQQVAAEAGQSSDPVDDEFDALLAQAAAVAPPAEADSGAISDDEFEALLDELHGAGKAPGAAEPGENPPPTPPSGLRPQRGGPEGDVSSDAVDSPAHPSKTLPLAREAGKGEREGDSSSRHTPTNTLLPETTIRVDTRRLDTLINLAGELVLARNRLLRLRPEGGDAELDKAVATLDLITNDMQTAVMGMRMQPVRKLFARFPKLVRELARGLDKRIELELAGEDTELDKSLVDALADPLVHLLRNAVDHGIEDPATRTAAGKPEAGSVRLGAAQQGEQIVITIADDGRGMDPDALRDKAVEKGLLTAEAAARLAPEECYELIFMPGFSTKAEVSEISGRGVGMDVVKSRIAELNGCIEISSALGAGSEIRVRVPLTLAILPTLMVCVAGRIFALPVANIGEVFELDRSALRALDGREVLMVRGRALPLVFLETWVCQGAARPQAPAAEHVVVVQAGSQRSALVVDDVLGREEVVIKPLGPLLQALPGLAGATITGDGLIALIVDFASLFGDPRAQPRAVEA